jgi:hypothetical protein
MNTDMRSYTRGESPHGEAAVMEFFIIYVGRILAKATELLCFAQFPNVFISHFHLAINHCCAKLCSITYLWENTSKRKGR